MNDAGSAEPRELKVGGPVDPTEHLYVTRDADREFVDLLNRGEFVNIVTSRQMGKTSLVYHAMAQLTPQGYRFAYCDLATLRSESDPRRYFKTLVGELARELKLDIDLEAFWAQRASRAVSQGFIDFFRQALANLAGPVVVVLDEIDSTLELQFTDDLFTAIRSIYTGRPREASLKRLSFCLVGVATPNELIKNRRSTPYNIGRTIWLTDFDGKHDNLLPLAGSLSSEVSVADQVLDRVLYWTDGQPYLSAWMCENLRREGVLEPQAADALVERTFTSLDRLSHDPHFEQTQRFVSDRVVNGAEVLGLYERILHGERERDQAANVAYAHLKLSGLVKRDGNGVLVPRNRIYERLFNLEWVQKSRPKQELRRYRRFAYAATAVFLLGVTGSVYYYQTSVVPLQLEQAELRAQQVARKALEDLQVTLSGDPRGWTDVLLPPQDPAKVLEQAIPHLVTISRGHEAQALSLDLSGVPAVDVNTLAPLTELRRLNLMGTKVADCRPLAKLSGLQALDISSTPVSGLSSLAALANLKELDASMTGVSDLTSLSALTNLNQLHVSFTRVSDLAPVRSLSRLQRLDVSNTPVKNLDPLSGLGGLRELNISRTKVEDLSPLQGLTSLRTLALDGLGITDFNADGHIPHLKVLQDPTPRKTGAAYRPGESFRDCRECPQMVVVPDGRFTMGSPKEEAGRADDEGPQHAVTIAEAFAVGTYEVRFDEWLLCVQAGRCRPVPDAGRGRGVRPVINVSWDDAQRYVDWLADKTGQPYRLLTEAEWEYAARADTKGPRYWTEQENACAYANVYDAQGENKYKFGWDRFDCDDGYPDTAPVGAFQPNAFGLYDMLGNVWEWVADCHHDSYRRAPVDGSAWVTKDCELRVDRGGGWGDGPQVVRSADRSRDSPEGRDDGLGFRVARTLTP